MTSDLKLLSPHDAHPIHTVTFGLVQMRCTPDPSPRTCARPFEGVRDAAARGAQIVCLQELFRSQYFCQTEDHRLLRSGRAGPGPLHRGSGRAGRSSGVVIVGSLFEKRARRPLPQYRRHYRCRRPLSRQVPEDAHSGRPAVLREVLLHARRPRFRSWDTRFGRIGVLVCWDQWYPEAARLTAMSGAADSVLSHRHRLATRRESRSTARSNRRRGKRSSEATPLPMASTSARSTGSATRATPEGGIEFWGGSFVSDPGGRLMVKGGTGKRC